MTQLVGTNKRPIYYIQPEMKILLDGSGLESGCEITYAQISENGLWIYFYSDKPEFRFQFPVIMIKAMFREYEEFIYEKQKETDL